MAQSSGGRVARRGPARDLLGRELLGYIREPAVRHLAAAGDPAAGLRQRDAHEPAAALARPARQRHHRAEGHQIAGDVVDGGDRIELWARLGTWEEVALALGDAAHG